MTVRRGFVLLLFILALAMGSLEVQLAQVRSDVRELQNNEDAMIEIIHRLVGKVYSNDN